MALLSGGSFTGLIPQIPTFTPPDFNSCVPDVFNLVQGGGAFQNPLETPIADCLAQLSSILGVGLPGGAELDAITSMVDVLGTTGIGGVPGLLAHSGGLVGNMPALMASGNSLLSGVSALSGIGAAALPGNPCELLDDIMGSVLGAANDAINSVADLVGPIFDAIGGPVQDVVDAITPVLGDITSAVISLSGIIQAEIDKLSEFLTDITNFSFAKSIPSLANDPCLQSIFNAVGTPDLINCLISGVPKFNVF